MKTLQCKFIYFDITHNLCKMENVAVFIGTEMDVFCQMFTTAFYHLIRSTTIKLSFIGTTGQILQSAKYYMYKMY